MIVFGVAVTRAEDYDRWAGPGIDRAREPDSAVYANLSDNSIFRAYNLLLDEAAAHDDLEALALLHQDVEIVDDRFCEKVRRTFSAAPQVAVAGCVGARDARTMAWWEGSVTWASFTHRYYEHGGGLIPAFSMSSDTAEHPVYARLGEVDTVDGFLMVLSPWAVRNLRFDESLGQFHGYDYDLCMQARRAGRTVMTSDLRVIHHHSLELMSDREGWIEVHMRLAEKWNPTAASPGGPGPATEADAWKARARRAEAQASANNVQRISDSMIADARERELLGELDEIRGSTSWRLTAPLRWLNARAGTRRRAPRPGPGPGRT